MRRNMMYKNKIIESIPVLEINACENVLINEIRVKVARRIIYYYT